MKKLVKISLIFIVGLIVCLFVFYKNTSSIHKYSKVKTKSGSGVDISKVQLEEIKNEKRFYREQKDKVQYVKINSDEVEIPILMYHSISDSDTNNSLLVSPSDFEEQIKWLKDNDFTPMLLDDAIEAMKTGVTPIKPVVITFDDGYADNYTSAYQILKKYNMKATFFVITSNIDKNSFYMSSDMLKEMSAFGMDIQNHTVNHRELNKLTNEDQIEEVKGAKQSLKAILNKDSEYVCYPVGRYDERTIAIQKEIGIEAAVTTNGGLASLNDGIYTLDRLRISPMAITEFSKYFSKFIE